MAKVRVIEVHENIFNTNNQEADALRKRLKDKSDNNQCNVFSWFWKNNTSFSCNQ